MLPPTTVTLRFALRYPRPTSKKICGVLSERCESEAQTEAALTAAPVGMGTCRPYGTTIQRWSPMPVSASPNWRR
jgi:hypothetical protein